MPPVKRGPPTLRSAVAPAAASARRASEPPGTPLTSAPVSSKMAPVEQGPPTLSPEGLARAAAVVRESPALSNMAPVKRRPPTLGLAVASGGPVTRAARHPGHVIARLPSHTVSTTWTTDTELPGHKAGITRPRETRPRTRRSRSDACQPGSVLRPLPMSVRRRVVEARPDRVAEPRISNAVHISGAAGGIVEPGDPGAHGRQGTTQDSRSPYARAVEQCSARSEPDTVCAVSPMPDTRRHTP